MPRACIKHAFFLKVGVVVAHTTTTQEDVRETERERLGKTETWRKTRRRRRKFSVASTKSGPNS